MLANVMGLDLSQAANPLYALPVIAVVVGILLVYAFGFKTPVQPPNFDDLESDKKSHKRRKAKDTQKAKQNAGKGASKNQNPAVEKKKKEKAPIPRVEPKIAKKPVLVLEKKKMTVQEEPDMTHDDCSEEAGWVHQISKKGRKKRKREREREEEEEEPYEVSVSTIVLQEIMKYVPPNERAETLKAIRAKKDPRVPSPHFIIYPDRRRRKDMTAHRGDVKESSTTSSVGEDNSEKSQLTDTIRTQMAKITKKKKKNINSLDSFSSDIGINKNPEEGKIDANTGKQMTMAAKKRAKKKKKKLEACAEEQTIAETAKVDYGLPYVGSSAVGVPWLPSEPSPTTAELPKSSSDNKSANVEGANDSKAAAFRKLGLYPVSKSSQKKRSARRDH